MSSAGYLGEALRKASSCSSRYSIYCI